MGIAWRAACTSATTRNSHQQKQGFAEKLNKDVKHVRPKERVRQTHEVTVARLKIKCAFRVKHMKVCLSRIRRDTLSTRFQNLSRKGSHIDS